MTKPLPKPLSPDRFYQFLILKVRKWLEQVAPAAVPKESSAFSTYDGPTNDAIDQQSWSVDEGGVYVYISTHAIGDSWGGTSASISVEGKRLVINGEGEGNQVMRVSLRGDEILMQEIWG